MDSNFNLALAIDQACEIAERFIDELRRNKPTIHDPRIGDVRLLDAFIRQIPVPPLPDRPIGGIPLQGLGLGVDQSRKIVEPSRPLDTLPQTSDPLPVIAALRPLLQFIYSGEGGYESYNRGRAGDSPGPWPGGDLRALTIGQIMDLQKQGKIYAVGAAQFIPRTLPVALKESKLRVSDLFNEQNQDRLTAALLLGTKRPALAAYLRGENNDLDAAHVDLAHEWASVPLPSGKGVFDGDESGNRATQKVQGVRSALQDARIALQKIKHHNTIDLVTLGDPDRHGTREPFSKPDIKQFIQSPNYESRNGAKITTIIIHYTTADNVESTIAHFRSPSSKVSAHYVIDKNGDIYQMVSDDQKAWHATSANASSIGIEHVARPGDRLTGAQELSSINLIKWLMSAYKIPKENIKAHLEVDDTLCPGSLFGDRMNDKALPGFKNWVATNFSRHVVETGPLGPAGLGLYIVQPGDSLSEIALRNDTSVDTLLQLNPSIHNPDLLSVGQRIIISRVEGDDPFIRTGSSALGLPVTIAEKALSAATYQVFNHPALGNITITGGYMEPHPDHSQKSQIKAIFREGSLKVLPPARRNIGIDYVVSDSRVKAWYGGVVTSAGHEGGYGRRIHIQLDVLFEFEGRRYQVYQAYAHLQQIVVSERQIIKQGQQIGIMGGSGSNGDDTYPSHVDLSTYLKIGSELVQLNPQALDLQLASQVLV